MQPAGTIIEGPVHLAHTECRTLLCSLTDWFGNEARDRYPRDAEVLPTFGARTAHDLIGFLTVKRHFPASAEIHFLAVHRDFHRRGVGTNLLAAAENWLRQDGARFLSVKTISEASANRFYVGTRQFYLDRGFLPFEEMPKFWNEANPCLVMVKGLDVTAA